MLPEYSPVFPKWPGQPWARVVPGADPQLLDLLSVRELASRTGACSCGLRYVPARVLVLALLACAPENGGVGPGKAHLCARST